MRKLKDNKDLPNGVYAFDEASMLHFLMGDHWRELVCGDRVFDPGVGRSSVGSRNFLLPEEYLL